MSLFEDMASICEERCRKTEELHKWSERGTAIISLIVGFCLGALYVINFGDKV